MKKLLRLLVALTAVIGLMSVALPPAGANVILVNSPFGGWYAENSAHSGVGDSYTYTQVTGKWTQPTVTCPSSGSYDLITYVGEDSIPFHHPSGFADPTEAVAVEVQCLHISGSTTIQTASAFSCMGDHAAGTQCEGTGAQTPFTVPIVAGDHYRAQVEAPNGAHTKWKFVLEDTTQSVLETHYTDCPTLGGCWMDRSYVVMTAYNNNGPAPFGTQTFDYARTTNQNGVTENFAAATVFRAWQNDWKDTSVGPNVSCASSSLSGNQLTMTYVADVCPPV